MKSTATFPSFAVAFRLTFPSFLATTPNPLKCPRLSQCLAALLLLIAPALSAQNPNGTWTFAVSGDSRNCGDIVMPAIAESAKRDNVAFYWHLGDYRAIYMVDEDYLSKHPGTNIIGYETHAWPDFIEHQIVPFGDLPVFLGRGNHETIPPKTRRIICAVCRLAGKTDSAKATAGGQSGGPPARDVYSLGRARCRFRYSRQRFAGGVQRSSGCVVEGRVVAG